MNNNEIIHVSDRKPSDIIPFETSPLLPPESLEKGISTIFSLDHSPLMNREKRDHIWNEIWENSIVEEHLGDYLLQQQQLIPGRIFPPHHPYYSIPINDDVINGAKGISENHNNERKNTEEIKTWKTLSEALQTIRWSFHQIDERTLRYLQYTPQLLDFSLVKKEWQALIPVEERIGLLFGLFDRTSIKPFHTFGQSIEKGEHSDQLHQPGHLSDEIYDDLVGHIQQAAGILNNALLSANQAYESLANTRPELAVDIKPDKYPSHLPFQIKIATTALQFLTTQPTRGGLYAVSFLYSMREIDNLIGRKIYRYDYRQEGILSETNKLLSQYDMYLPRFAEEWGGNNGYKPIKKKDGYGHKNLVELRKI